MSATGISFDRPETSIVPDNFFTKSGPVPEGSPVRRMDAYIVSLHFNPITFTSSYVNLNVDLKAVTNKTLKKQLVSVAHIPDCIEIIQNSDGDTTRPRYHAGINIANTFVHDHLVAMVGVNLTSLPPVMPGIGVSETPVPSDSLIETLLRNQLNYCNGLIAQAEVHFQSDKLQLITDDMRKAADYMGVQVAWRPRAVGLNETMACINCSEPIKATAKGCKECGAPQDKVLYQSWFDQKYTPVSANPVQVTQGTVKSQATS